jgi:leucyl aminopeptidase (aminopeptidase T)
MAQSPDYDALARTIVTQNAGVRAGDKVLILGSVRDLELLEDLSVQARAVGAFPLIEISSERLIKRMFDDVPAEHDTEMDAMAMALTEIVDVVIEVPVGAEPGLLAHVPPERFATRATANQAIDERNRERGVRYVEVGNELYPTEWRAEQWGITKDALADLFWDGIAVDYAELQNTGQAVAAHLSDGSEVRVTHSNGTDITFSIEGRPVYVSDGVISDEDRQRGGAGVSVWLPAGEVYVTAVPGTAEGTVVFDDDQFEGEEVRNLRLEFADGTLTSMNGEGPGFDRLRRAYDVSDDRKTVFGLLDIGLNPRLEVPELSQVESYSPAGTVTLGFGNNTWAGGDNTSNFGYGDFLRGATVTVDGETLVDGGALTP